MDVVVPGIFPNTFLFLAGVTKFQGTHHRVMPSVHFIFKLFGRHGLQFRWVVFLLLGLHETWAGNLIFRYSDFNDYFSTFNSIFVLILYTMTGLETRILNKRNLATQLLASIRL